MEWERHELEVQAASLLWYANDLYDVAGGWTKLTGEPESSRWAPFGEFDTAVMSPGEDLVALVDSVGTKALLMRPLGPVIREVNRSWYHASDYRYPLALFTLPDGRTGLAHCPQEYCRLEFEVAETGEPLTAAADREPPDVFHSRLMVRKDGSHLLSAGWLWHPVGVAAIFDIERALADPRLLDAAPGSTSFLDLAGMEVQAATFVEDRVCVFLVDEFGDEPLKPSTLGRWSPARDGFVWAVTPQADINDLLPCGPHILALSTHPQLYDGKDGQLIAEWPELRIPGSYGSIVHGRRAGSAVVAVDPARPRFAVAGPDVVSIITLA